MGTMVPGTTTLLRDCELGLHLYWWWFLGWRSNCTCFPFSVE